MLLNFEKQFPKSTLLLPAYESMLQIYREKNDEANVAIIREKLIPLERQLRTPGPRGQPVVTGGITTLLLAARENSLEAARFLVAAGTDVNLSKANETNPLLMAILNAHYELADFLLESGANPNLANSDGKAALYAAVEMRNLATTDTPGPPADKAEALELIKTILRHKTDPNAQLTRNRRFAEARIGHGFGAEVIDERMPRFNVRLGVIFQSSLIKKLNSCW